MVNRIVCAGLVFLMFGACNAQELKKGMSFVKARRALLAQNWIPVLPHRDVDDSLIGLETRLINAHIVEVELCAADKSLCWFNYRKGAACLRVLAVGEKIKDMVIVSWGNACLDED